MTKPEEGKPNVPDVFHRRKLEILAAEASTQPLPAPEETTLSQKINALPDWLRQYIHDIETKCDPAGDIRTITELRDTIRVFQVLKSRCNCGCTIGKCVHDECSDCGGKNGAASSPSVEPAPDVHALRTSLGQMLKLIEDGILVRSTANDGNTLRYLKDSTRLIAVIKTAQEIL